MRTRFTPLLIGFLALPWVAQAQSVEAPDAAETRINKTVEQMIDRDPSTAGMVEATEWENQQWDQLMNAAYQALLTYLPDSDKKLLQDAQRTWITFRDQDRKAQRALYLQKDGTMYIPMAAHSGMLLTKHRAIELATLVQIWRIDGE